MCMLFSHLVINSTSLIDCGVRLTFHTLNANWISLADINKSSSTKNKAEIKCKAQVDND